MTEGINSQSYTEQKEKKKPKKRRSKKNQSESSGIMIEGKMVTVAASPPASPESDSPILSPPSSLNKSVDAPISINGVHRGKESPSFQKTGEEGWKREGQQNGTSQNNEKENGINEPSKPVASKQPQDLEEVGLQKEEDQQDRKMESLQPPENSEFSLNGEYTRPKSQSTRSTFSGLGLDGVPQAVSLRYYQEYLEEDPNDDEETAEVKRRLAAKMRNRKLSFQKNSSNAAQKFPPRKTQEQEDDISEYSFPDPYYPKLNGTGPKSTQNDEFRTAQDRSLSLLSLDTSSSLLKALYFMICPLTSGPFPVSISFLPLSSLP